MCADCEARRKLARDAWLRASMGEVIAQVATGAAEAFGLKEKSGEADMRERSRERQTKSNSGAAG